MSRDTSRDGFWNRAESAFLHFKPVWRLVQAFSGPRKFFNGFLINRAIKKTKFRPHQFSMMTDYTSWESLTDRTFSGRHLPSAEAPFSNALPEISLSAALFQRPEGQEIKSAKSTLLFSYFAQWFTDGFLRTDRTDFRKNTSNHEIDLSPLYGMRKSDTEALREKAGGRLKSQMISGEEYSPYYFQENGMPREEFANLALWIPPSLPDDKRAFMFATGVERGNNQIGYVMLNTLFLREHNRIAGLLNQAYLGWDDERIFQTTRNTVIALVLKIVIEEYINHIKPYPFKFRADPTTFWRAPWYRTNWMTVEFNLLYRWHSLVPDKILYDKTEIPLSESTFNNKLLIDRGLAMSFDDASRYHATEMGLFNTTAELLHTEQMAIEMGRKCRLRSYNEYRALFGFPKVTRFEQISGRSDVVEELRKLYRNVDQVELFVGLFAEDVRESSALPPLIGRMVAVDAFSQALTNPLLSEHVFNEQTFSPIGWRIIQETETLSQLVQRNSSNAPKDLLVTMTQPKMTR